MASTEVRVRQRTDIAPPAHAIDCFTKAPKGSCRTVGQAPESRPGFLGKVSKAGPGPEYRAWRYAKGQYTHLGVFPHVGAAIEALKSRNRTA